MARLVGRKRRSLWRKGWWWDRGWPRWWEEKVGWRVVRLIWKRMRRRRWDGR